MENHLHLLGPFSVRLRGGPAYRQLASFVAGLIRCGLLPPGSRLPAEREVVAALGLSRTTVTGAYAELTAQGLVAARAGSGTFVAKAATGSAGFSPTPWGEPPPVTLDALLSLGAGLRPLETAGDLISFAAGTPAPELAAVDLSPILSGVMPGTMAALPASTPPAGLPELRAGVAAWMAARGHPGSLPPTAADILITSGSQQALDLVVRALVRPGDAILVQGATYVGAIQLFKALGAHLVEFDPAEEPARTCERLRRHNPRFVYVMPTYQNPTGHVMPVPERLRVLQVADCLGIPVVEDDPYGELWFDGPPPPRLRDLAPKGGPPVLTLGTLSKLLSPGLRLGWICAPAGVLQALIQLKQVSDLYTSTLSQTVALHYFREGLLAAHAQRARRVYRARLDAVVVALAEHLPQAAYTAPGGGFYLWCRLAGVNTLGLLPVALRHGVAFMPGASFYPGAGDPAWLRISFASPAAADLVEGIRRLAAAVADRAGRSGLRWEAAFQRRGRATCMCYRMCGWMFLPMRR